MEERKETTEEHLEHTERTVTEPVPVEDDAEVPEPGVETPVQGMPDADDVREDPHDEMDDDRR